MKIAVILPVGPLDRYGYQYVYDLTIPTMCAFADQVYMISSTRNPTNVSDLLKAHPNLRYISDKRSWFEGDREVFSNARYEENVNRMMRRCAKDGMDVAFQIHVNQYIPQSVRPLLQQRARRLVKHGNHASWIYRRYQLGDRWFHCDDAAFWMVNLHMPGWSFVADGLYDEQKKKIKKRIHNDFRHQNHLAVVDAALEFPLVDLTEKMNFVRCYKGLSPWRSAEFRWSTWKRYYAAKFRQKALSNDPLPPTGRKLAERSQKDFVSWAILNEL